ncbi:MAG: 3-deoxy-manno-octulosonate cytidylyltransferase [Bacteroidales bacterium]|nr:3-deoxy-manno-octulosonate cytidylyltransferase [Bacteroidales bacterium]
MKALAVIPARYASTRFPGKPLALLGGRPIIDYAYTAARFTTGIERAVVATDDERIFAHVEQAFGKGSVMMTSTEHRSGTDRCGEVVRRLEAEGEHYDVVVNLQGDEPFVESAQLQMLVGCFADETVSIATLKTRIASTAELLSPNNVKVVCTTDGKALYFSRQTIPYRRDVDPAQWLAEGQYFKHVGIYAFRPQVLAEVCAMKQSQLELSEKLEQLRWLEAGYSIAVCETPTANIGIDTPADLEAAERVLRNNERKTQK